MRDFLKTIWDDAQRGLRAPVRSLVIGTLAAFVVSLPVTVALQLMTAVHSAVIYVVTGAVHALATFIVAGRQERTSWT